MTGRLTAYSLRQVTIGFIKSRKTLQIIIGAHVYDIGLCTHYLHTALQQAGLSSMSFVHARCERFQWQIVQSRRHMAGPLNRSMCTCEQVYDYSIQSQLA